MWLLDTSRAELHFFHGPEHVPGGYAILSHVWEGQEQTFSELQALAKMHNGPNENPRDYASDKVRRFCELAEKLGHTWGWADMCCIDKSSSAELSEAINSMYRYYSMADICYAYLFDVPTGDLSDISYPGPVEMLSDGGSLVRSDSSLNSDRLSLSDQWSVRDDESLRDNANVRYVYVPPFTTLSTEQMAFANSRWHRRGWTLQELIAPDVVVFVSRAWDILGAKADLPNLLHNITCIPPGVLTMMEEPEEFSIAQRMSWAAKRETTRLEDAAYCLMGIFDVNMPTLYGEGRRAFRRLQEEILKRSADTSLFAWPRKRRDSKKTEIDARWSKVDRCRMDHAAGTLFAEVPSSFSQSYVSTFYQAKSFDIVEVPKSLRKLPTFSITSYGVLAHIVVLRSRSRSLSKVYALLCWTETRTPQTVVALGLARCKNTHDVSRPLYHASHIAHFTVNTISMLFKRNARNINWEDIYIIHEPSRHRKAHVGAVNASLSSPFRVSSSALLQELKPVGITTITPSQLPLPWDGSTPLTVRFSGCCDGCVFYVHLGCCAVSEVAAQSSRYSRSRWATVSRHLPADPTVHVCAVDHIDSWPDHSRVFHGVVNYKYSHRPTRSVDSFYVSVTGNVRLSFSPSALRATNGASSLELSAQVLDVSTVAEPKYYRYNIPHQKTSTSTSGGSGEDHSSTPSPADALRVGSIHNPPIVGRLPGYIRSLFRIPSKRPRLRRSEA